MACSSFPEDEQVVYYEVQYSREKHSGKVADDHIPAGKPLDEQKKTEPEQKDGRIGQVIFQIQPEEASDRGVRPVAGPVLPYEEVRDHIIDGDGALERECIRQPRLPLRMFLSM